MSDVYQTPQADFNQSSTPNNQYGSVEQALAGDYSIAVGDVMSEAWNLSNGAKLNIHLSLLVYFVAYIVVMIVVGIALNMIGLGSPDELGAGFLIMLALNTVIAGILISFATAPLWVGVMYLGVKRSVNEQLQPSSVLNYFYATVPLGLAFVLMYILISIGFFLLIIPGIYLSIAYSMSLILVVDKGMSPWKALETSRKAVTKHWFSLFVLFLAISIINALGTIPLGLGLIWTVPMSIIAYGIAYRNMFGYSGAKAE